MITLRKAGDRGVSKIDWLDSRHTFSFADYYDREQMGFRQLRVINEDRVRPGNGFPTHSHRDMEIISYVLNGALEHRDSLGNGSIIRPGEVQRMSAGRGITHSEFNPSREELLHFLQIWILPERTRIPPGYEQQAIDLSAARGVFRPIASGVGGPKQVRLHQDATMSLALLESEETLLHRIAAGRYEWLQLVRGTVGLNGQTLTAGDGAAIEAESDLTIEARDNCEMLLFDLA